MVEQLPVVNPNPVDTPQEVVSIEKPKSNTIRRIRMAIFTILIIIVLAASAFLLIFFKIIHIGFNNSYNNSNATKSDLSISIKNDRFAYQLGNQFATFLTQTISPEIVPPGVLNNNKDNVIGNFYKIDETKENNQTIYFTHWQPLAGSANINVSNQQINYLQISQTLKTSEITINNYATLSAQQADRLSVKYFNLNNIDFFLNRNTGTKWACYSADNSSICEKIYIVPLGQFGYGLILSHAENMITGGIFECFVKPTSKIYGKLKSCYPTVF